MKTYTIVDQDGVGITLTEPDMHNIVQSLNLADSAARVGTEYGKLRDRLRSSYKELAR